MTDSKPRESSPPDAVDACPFGPTLFLQFFSGLVRDRCPAPSERVPRVRVHLVTGEVLEVCHIAWISPSWLSLVVAAKEPPEVGAMQTELVPYATITRITISSVRRSEAQIGFNLDHRPLLAVPGVGPPGTAQAGVLPAEEGAHERADC